MPYSLEELVSEISTTLKADNGPSGRAKICHIVSSALSDSVFTDLYLGDRDPGDDPREILYEDPEQEFCICGHSWAVYGQATGETVMTEWRIVEAGTGDAPSLVEPVETYVMKPGDARLYDVGAIHSPHREQPVKLLRVEGTNLDHVTRGNYRIAD